MLFRSLLGAPDPDVVARTAADRTPIPADLSLARWTVMLVWPAAATLGAALVFFLTSGRSGRGEQAAEQAAAQPPTQPPTQGSAAV